MTSDTSQPIQTAPLGRVLELAVIDKDGLHALVCPCHRMLDRWVKAETNEPFDVQSTH